MSSRSLSSLLCHSQLVLICALSHAPAQAVTTVYRCGEVYQPYPCPGGHAMRVIDERTGAQREQALEQLELEQRHAQALRKERLERERLAAAPVQPGRLDAPPPAPQPARKSPNGQDNPCDEPPSGHRSKAAGHKKKTSPAASACRTSAGDSAVSAPHAASKGSKRKSGAASGSGSGSTRSEAAQPTAGTGLKAVH